VAQHIIDDVLFGQLPRKLITNVK